MRAVELWQCCREVFTVVGFSPRGSRKLGSTTAVSIQEQFLGSRHHQAKLITFQQKPGLGWTNLLKSIDATFVFTSLKLSYRVREPRTTISLWWATNWKIIFFRLLIPPPMTTVHFSSLKSLKRGFPTNGEIITPTDDNRPSRVRRKWNMILFILAASVLPETREAGKLSFTAEKKTLRGRGANGRVSIWHPKGGHHVLNVLHLPHFDILLFVILCYRADILLKLFCHHEDWHVASKIPELIKK